MTQQRIYGKIRDYGIIGDCHTAALVSQNGSIDWYCPRRFDDPAVFCQILDAEKGGFFKISPLGEFSSRRQYLKKTNILENTFSSEKGEVRLSDLMPVFSRTVSSRGHDVGTSRRILRLVEVTRGQMELEVVFFPTFDYARGNTLMAIEPNFGIVAHEEGHFLSMASPDTDMHFNVKDGLSYGRLAAEEGEKHWFVLTHADDPDRVRELSSSTQCENQLERSRKYWEDWSARCTYRGPYRDEVLRSALTLKLLIYEPTGAIIAAPTTSLPEEIGGERNWDYRYSWIRDSALILYALVSIGYREEAADFFEWLQEIHHDRPSRDVRVLYSIDGRQSEKEAILGHLDGYMHSRPVRIGNAATEQLQLDIYGELLVSAYLYFRSRIGKRNALDEPTGIRSLELDWPLLSEFVNEAANKWNDPDNGIWEVRGGIQHFLYSKLMCWAALDRGIRLAKEYSLPAPRDRWLKIRDEIRESILSSGYNQGLNAFVQVLGGSALDASSLLIPRIGLLPATDMRIQTTINRIQKDLVNKRLVYRYRGDDGIKGNEATFATCTFWLVDALALSGRVQEAHELFEWTIGYQNDLGLFSEEIDPTNGNLLGNFPQGFSHMALINAAVNLAKVIKHGAEEHSENEAERAEKAKSAASEGYSRDEVYSKRKSSAL
jgi:GH15 family glucan-1,4-alpha-glucosidase